MCAFGSAALLTSRHDGRVQAVPKIVGHLVDFVATVDLDGLSRGVKDDLAVAALLQVRFNFSASLSGNRVVDQIVENGEKLGAGHDAASRSAGI